MQTRTYQFYTTNAQANACNIQILAPGYIHGICWSVKTDGAADNMTWDAELSFQSASQLTVHNAQGVIDSIGGYNNLLTSGYAITDYNKNCMGIYIPVGVGQIVYMNTTHSFTSIWFRALMHVIER